MYEVGSWQLDPARRELRLHGHPVPIGQRAFDIIETLVQARGGLVTKDALMERVWPGAMVGENTIQVHVSAIRKVLGDDRAMLLTEAGRGYRLLGEWATRHPADDAPAAPPAIVPPAAEPPQGNLPTPGSDLIGRAAVVQHVCDLLSAYRLVTLTGAGGIGKTRVALEVAHSLRTEYRGDVWLVELAPLTDPGLVAVAIAGALGLTLGRNGVTPEALAQAIGNRRLLLVLDNCEHLIEAAAATADTLMRRCPALSMLATSREVMHLVGEQAYRVPPLDLPDRNPPEADRGDIRRSNAVQLFISRMLAQQAGGGSPGPDELTAIAAICRRLDGIPLAIEFAAARAVTLGVQQVLSHLDDRFLLLTSGRRTALPKHRTLRATFDWSYQLLTEAERDLFRRLAIFPGSFTLRAAHAVAGEAVAASDVADSVAELAWKSLIIRDMDTAAAEFRLLETTRVYALEKLAESGVLPEVARRHAEYFRQWLRSIGAAPASQPAVRLAELRRGADDVRTALDWAFSAGGDTALGLVLTIAAMPLWFALSQMTVAHTRVEHALRLVEPGSRQEMHLQVALGHALWYLAPEQGEKIEPAFMRALDIAEHHGSAAVQAKALWGLWAVRRGRGDYRAALGMAIRYEAAARLVGDGGSVHLADRILGLTQHYLGNQAAARRFTERALRESRPVDAAASLGFQVETPIAMPTLLARILWLQGFADQALAAAQQAIDAAQQSGHQFSICYSLVMSGVPVAMWTGDLAMAQRRVDMLLQHGVAALALEPYVRCQGRLIRLRQGNARDMLLASYYAPRLDLPTVGALATVLSEATVAMPVPGVGLVDARWNAPELLRVDADLLLQDGAPDAASAAEANLQRALALAREQAALAWELRAAISLARLWRGQGEAAQAHALLAPLYGRFTEGFATADLVEAQRLLAELEASPPSAAYTNRPNH